MYALHISVPLEWAPGATLLKEFKSPSIDDRVSLDKEEMVIMLMENLHKFSFQVEEVSFIWPFMTIQLLGFIAASHALIYKRDSRSSTIWVGLIILSPILGPALYWLFGINRIRRKAIKVFKDKELEMAQVNRGELSLDKWPSSMIKLSHLTQKVSGHPLTLQNEIQILQNGEEFYPAIMASIHKAKKYIYLCSYIFENDIIGKKIADALKKAGERGIIVRVLVDDIGSKYSFPTIFSKLAGRNIRTAKFQKTFWPWTFHYAQLRNHRKILIVDGNLAYIGGMNLRDQHLISSTPLDDGITDIHFKVTGEMIGPLECFFISDWNFSSSEFLNLSELRPLTNPSMNIPMRALSSGPDEEVNRLKIVFLGAITSAEKSIYIVTPYFIPDLTIISALGVASAKGVDIKIILPERNNYRLIQWATSAILWQILEAGCEVYYSSLPFDHAKLFVVDEIWVCVGSANWDARSLRLNFELNIECYDANFARQLLEIIQRKIEKARKIEADEVNRRSYGIKLRDGMARLLNPFL